MKNWFKTFLKRLKCKHNWQGIEGTQEHITYQVIEDTGYGKIKQDYWGMNAETFCPQCHKRKRKHFIYNDEIHGMVDEDFIKGCTR